MCLSPAGISPHWLWWGWSCAPGNCRVVSRQLPLDCSVSPPSIRVPLLPRGPTSSTRFALIDPLDPFLFGLFPFKDTASRRGIHGSLSGVGVSPCPLSTKGFLGSEPGFVRVYTVVSIGFRLVRNRRWRGTDGNTVAQVCGCAWSNRQIPRARPHMADHVPQEEGGRRGGNHGNAGRSEGRGMRTSKPRKGRWKKEGRPPNEPQPSRPSSCLVCSTWSRINWHSFRWPTTSSSWPSS